MAYNSYPLNYGQLYNPFNSPVSQPIAQTTPISPTPNLTQSNASGAILWVQGEAGAKAYPVAAGNSVLLMDSERQVFYIKSTDSSGMPQPLRRFVYHEDVAENATPSLDTSQFITREEFEKALSEFRPKTRAKKKEVEDNE